MLDVAIAASRITPLSGSIRSTAETANVGNFWTKGQSEALSRHTWFIDSTAVEATLGGTLTRPILVRLIARPHHLRQPKRAVSDAWLDPHRSIRIARQPQARLALGALMFRRILVTLASANGCLHLLDLPDMNQMTVSEGLF